jgi:hypothetical protein
MRIRRGSFLVVVALVGLLGGACDKVTATVSSGRTSPPARADADASPRTSPHTGALAPAMSSDAGAPPPTNDAVGVGGADSSEALQGEERERDPRSDTVKIKVLVDSRRQAHVLWGRKDFGVAPLEIERPRNSGPLDLVVVAPGYLSLHARAFTDRDDTLALRLYAPSEAPQLLGYRSGFVPAGPDTK